ncbi:MAG: methylated-DNA--[protein]-cysteine S-methyltransferase [Xanthomonadales bacterium]|nr:methylated-DNA--[protein]-cysteine S-methyltransferase [Gammaproteobacteria bacterium]MBT8055025.1 methylated-DNA--[protein]-cysteine S-methyltransferase [Gammaproteobacteria bacterium]NND56407.1 methylated-DNA--[protein]-cysteine S-methyltransferase [Xanthomonadales bacterium]
MTEHQAEQPGLSELSAALKVSPYHLQRTFQDWAGVSPKQFLKSLTRKAALERLAAGVSVLDSALDSGLSGPGRLHDLLISTDSLTPGEIRRRGGGVRLEYGFGQTPFGTALVAWNTRGLSFLGFCEEKGRAHALAGLRKQWIDAALNENVTTAQTRLDQVFQGSDDKPVAVWLRGSPFQLKVWEALLAIPEGSHRTYGQLARSVGKPGAARAVGTAVGSNPLSFVIPCHRVIRQAGELGGYRWGEHTKKAIIGREAASCGL